MRMIMTFRDTARTSYYREILMYLLEEGKPDEVVISSAVFFPDRRFLDITNSKGHSLRELLEHKSILIGKEGDGLNKLITDLSPVKTFSCPNNANWFENVIVLKKEFSGEMCNVAAAVGESSFTQRDMDWRTSPKNHTDFDYKVDTFYFDNTVSPDVGGIMSGNHTAGETGGNLSGELAGILDRAEGNGIIIMPEMPDQSKLLDEVHDKLMSQVRRSGMFKES